MLVIVMDCLVHWFEFDWWLTDWLLMIDWLDWDRVDSAWASKFKFVIESYANELWYRCGNPDRKWRDNWIYLSSLAFAFWFSISTNMIKFLPSNHRSCPNSIIPHSEAIGIGMYTDCASQSFASLQAIPHT